MRIQKSSAANGGTDKEEFLPNIVRDLILHDRGNSLFLSDSFANLPSPVNETRDLKSLFKPQEGDEGHLKNKKKDEKDENAIKIEGKGIDESTDKKPMANINVKEIERIVFRGNKKGDTVKAG